MKIGWRRFARPSFWGLVVLATVLMGGAGVYAIVTDLTDVKNVHTAAAVHVDQQELLDLVLAGHDDEAFEEAFELGDELFATLFNAIDGVGANVGRGQRFTRVPRADLKGTGEWFRHTPVRVTRPQLERLQQLSLPSLRGRGGRRLGERPPRPVPHRDRVAVRAAQHPPRLRDGRHPAPGRGDDRRAASRGAHPW